MNVDSGRRRILFVEDDDALLRLGERALTKAGYDVECAHNGLEGLLAIDRGERRPDLVICDLNMPELDGLEFVRALRGHPQTRRMPVIFTTARSDTKSVAEGISLGARYYVTKPYTVEDLNARVRRAIGE